MVRPPQIRTIAYLPIVLVCLLVFCYSLQVMTCSGLKLDDAEEVFWSQSLDWGYYHQPPLYTWLVQTAFALVGVSNASVIAVRYIIIACVYLGLYACSRANGQDKHTAFLVSGSLLLIPNFAEVSLRWYSHSILASALLVATYFIMLQLQRTRKTRWYLALGLSFALGTLSKYNFVLFAGILLGTAFSIPSFRRSLLDRRIGFSFILAGIVIAPHAIWAFAHRHEITSYLSYRGAFGNPTASRSIILALATLFRAGLDIPGLLVVVWLICFHSASRSSPTLGDFQADTARWLERFVFLTAGALLLLPLLAGTNRFEDYWLQPFGVLIPCFLFSRINLAEYAEWQIRRYECCLLVATLVVVILQVAAPWQEADECTPYSQLIADFQTAGYAGGPIVTSDRTLAGNLRILYPHDKILCLGQATNLDRLSEGDGCLVVWKTQISSRALPPGLESFVAESLHRDLPTDLEIHLSTLPLRGKMGWTNCFAFEVFPSVTQTVVTVSGVGIRALGQ